jgi:hypothetical protein
LSGCRQLLKKEGFKHQGGEVHTPTDSCSSSSPNQHVWFSHLKPSFFPSVRWAVWPKWTLGPFQLSHLQGEICLSHT